MIIVDSSVWIDFFNGVESRETDLLAELLPRSQVAIGDIILAEVLQGFRADKDFRLARNHLSALPCLVMGSKEIAIRSAESYRFLRKKGVTIRKTVDLIIGTFCIEQNHDLLHADRDFEPMVEHLGLQVL